MKILVSTNLYNSFIPVDLIIKLMEMNSSVLEKFKVSAYYPIENLNHYSYDSDVTYSHQSNPDYIWLEMGCAVQKKSELEYLYKLDEFENRTHPDLIKVFEDNPHFFEYNYKIIEIPDDVEWVICNNGFSEYIREKGREWR